MVCNHSDSYHGAQQRTAAEVKAPVVPQINRQCGGSNNVAAFDEIRVNSQIQRVQNSELLVVEVVVVEFLDFFQGKNDSFHSL